MPGALAIPRRFLDPKQVGIAGERAPSDPPYRFACLEPRSHWQRLGSLAAGGIKVPEVAQLVTILSTRSGMFHLGVSHLGIEITQNLPRASE